MQKLFASVTLIAVLSLAGCAYNSSRVQDVLDKDGKVVGRFTKARAFTFFDANSQLAKFHASNGTNGQHIYASGLSDNSSGSNVVALITASGQVIGLAAQGAVAGAK